MKIVFFGTSNVALPVLETLNKNHQVIAVVTAADSPVGKKQTITPSPVAVLAGEMHLPLLKPETVKNNTEFIAELQKLGADIFIVVSYGKILPLEVVNIPKLKTLNIHFSLLPKYRGAAPIQFALQSGDTTTGTTIFVLDENMDTGPILASKEVAVDNDDNFITLSEKLATISANLLIEILPQYESGTLIPKPQEGALSTTKIISKEDGKIDWSQTASEIYNKFRAYYDWPGIWTTWNGQALKILDCSVVDATAEQAPSTVLFTGQVACGKNTVLQINQLQLAGKNATDVKSFMNGYKEFLGSNLGN